MRDSSVTQIMTITQIMTHTQIVTLFWPHENVTIMSEHRFLPTHSGLLRPHVIVDY